MSDDDRKPITIAHVEAQDPPPGVTTIARWLKWREEENARMLEEARAQIRAFIERERGDGTLH